ncbi:ABC transporter permease [Limibacterium fermenti]|uniref:ABC transporter permease n=1 Tax=Limibacterium fermenti TaxID=3229863 RepID=UPI003A5EACAC
MNELLHVIQREYVTRVRTKSFILITLLTPLLLSSIFVLPAYFAKQHEDYKQLKIGIVDPTHALDGTFKDSEFSVERLENQPIEEIKQLLLNNQWEGIIYVVSSDSTGMNVQYYSAKQPSIFLQNRIKSEIEKVIVNDKLSVYGIRDIESLIFTAKQSVRIENIRVGTENKQTGYAGYQRSLCLALGVTIYMFIFLFSSQVMRGVLEEKSNRIVELIITSISPVKFMIGKIIGIALLGLTQIACWLIIMYCFSLFFSSGSEMLLNNKMMSNRISPEDINQILSNLSQIDFNVIIPVFLFFFVGGYLLYSSIFAAISATANHSDDIQQVTMIVTIPLILSVFVLSNTINSPDSTLSYWFSIIPFTSPIIMTSRVVYGAPVKDILLSMALLVTTVSLIIWLSGKIYKTAILFTGKKINIKDIISWIRKTN